MSAFTVQLAANAQQQASEIDTWWRENRPEAGSLFLTELGSALGMLQTTPAAAPVYVTNDPRLPVIRRMALRKTRCHVYYAVDDARRLVTVRAIWHASRGKSPRL